MNIVFFGTSEFSIPALAKLISSGIPPCLVVSTPDRPRGRKLTLSPTPVKEYAKKNNIPIFTPETLKNKETKDTLIRTGADLFIIASYGKIIPKDILGIPKKRTLNIHPSLLPKLRGPSPIQYTILQNETPGVTIMLTDEQTDHGAILISEKLKAKSEKYTYKELETELAELGARLLLETIPKWMNGEMEPKEQDHKQATFTKKITKEDGHINWKEPAETIERKIRAFNPWPGTYTFWEHENKKIRLLILEGDILNEKNGTPGTIFRTAHNTPAVMTGNGSLSIKKIKLAGKNAISGEEFLKGYKNNISDILQ